MTIYETIKKIRKLKNLTQKQFVQPEFPVSYLSKVENGTVVPSEDFLQMISKKWNIPLPYFNLINDKKQINEVLKLYETTKVLTENEVVFLNLCINPSHSIVMLLRIFSTLLDFYLAEEDHENAKRIFLLSKPFKKNIPNRVLKDIAQYYLVCGRYLYRNYHFREAKQYCHLAFESVNLRTFLVADICYYIGIIELKLGKRDTLILKQALHLYMEFESEEGIIRTLNGLSIQYMYNHDKHASLKVLNQANGLVQNPVQSCIVAHYFGCVYQQLGIEDLAIKYYKKSLDIEEKSNCQERVSSLKNLIEIYLKNQDFEQVKFYLSQLEELIDRYKLYFEHAEIKSLHESLV